MSVEYVFGDDGTPIPIESAQQTLTYNGPGGAVDTITLEYQGASWRQTFTYTGSNITRISKWVRQ